MQIYLLLSCAPIEGRISGIVDVPNACATLALPLAIFDKVYVMVKLLLQTCPSSITWKHEQILLHPL